MSVLGRGVRNAFRNGIRTFSIVAILGLSVALALSMLLARHAVEGRIDTVEGSIGNVVTISPAGLRGFAGGGEPLTNTQMDTVAALPHVAGLTTTLQDRLTADTTDLQSALELGTLGRRFQGADDGGGAGGGAVPLPGGLTGADGTALPFTPPVIAIGTTDPTNLSSVGGGTFALTTGAVFASNSNDDVALVGDGLATKNARPVGSTFQAYGTTVTVVGTFGGGNRFSDSLVVLPLATLQRLSGQDGAVTNAVVRVDAITNLDATVAAIKSTLGDAADVVSQQDTSQQALEPLHNIASISLFSLTGAIVAGAVIVFLSMLMIVRERRREIAVLKALGAPNRKVILQFTYEAITFTLMGAALGLLGGVLLGNPVTRLLVDTNSDTSAGGGPVAFGPGGAAGAGAQALRQGGGAALRLANQGPLNLNNIHAAIGWSILGYGLLAALVIAILGSALPSWLIARIRPAEVLRGE